MLYEADEVQLPLNCCSEADIKGQVAVKNTTDEPETLREETKAVELYSMKDFNYIAHWFWHNEPWLLYTHDLKESREFQLRK